MLGNCVRHGQCRGCGSLLTQDRFFAWALNAITDTYRHPADLLGLIGVPHQIEIDSGQ